MSLSTNCPKCGRPKATTMRTQQATPYAPGCSPAADVAYLVRKSQQQLAVNQVVTAAWNERLYGDVPPAPSWFFTPEETRRHERALQEARQRMAVNADDNTVPDPPSWFFAKP